MKWLSKWRRRQSEPAAAKTPQTAPAPSPAAQARRRARPVTLGKTTAEQTALAVAAMNAKRD